MKQRVYLVWARDREGDQDTEPIFISLNKEIAIDHAAGNAYDVVTAYNIGEPIDRGEVVYRA